MYWCLRKRGVPEKLVRLVEATYHGASFLFIVVLDFISKEFRCGLPSELLFADDLAVVTDR